MNNLLSRTIALILCITALGFADFNPVFAQSAPQSSENSLEVVLVTARKKDEAITDIPLAITAFDAGKIESLGLQGILDLPAVTPGFVYEEFAGIPGRFDNSPRFRGISVNSISPSRQTASVFVDGIFVSNGVQGIGLQDVERIEVIKGPQSAYFGRLTFGGAVNYITKTPGSEFGGKITGTIASEDDYRFDAGIEGPIGDNLAGRLSVGYVDQGGHYNAATSGDELGQERTSSISGSLVFTPTENFTAKVRAYYYENDDGAPAYSFSGVNDHNCGPLGGPADDTTICGDVPINAPDLNVAVSQGLRNAINALPATNGTSLNETGLERESTRLSAQFTYDLPGTDMTLSGLFGINDEEVRLLRDADDSADLAFQSFSGRSFEDNSAEIRLAGISFDDSLEWSIGFNSFNQEFSSGGDFIVPLLGFLDFGGSNPDLEDISTIGIFGSLAYDFSDAFTLTVEGRYQEDEVIDDGDILDTEPGQKVEFDNFLPRVIAEWSVNDDILLYGSYSEGNLPGGFNGEVDSLTPAQLAQLREIQSDADRTFDEEKLANYEIGYKQTLPNSKGTVTLALFHMERTNQTFRRADVVDDPGSATGFNQVDYFINAGKSDVNGLEFEGDYNVTDSFQLSATLAYIDSEFKVFNSGVHDELFGTEDASGKRGERFPEWSGSLSGIFAGDFASRDMEWFARVDLFYTGERFADEGNLTTAASGTQLNLRGGIEKDNYRVELFVTNATDDDTPTAINRFRDLSFATPLFDFSTLGYQVGLRDKRQVGLRASYKF